MKIKAIAACGAALLLVPCAAIAQDETATTDASVQADAAADVAAAADAAAAAIDSLAAPAQLPANTPIILSMNHELHSRHSREGETFPLTVVQDVAVDGQVVIPRGSRAMGEIVWRTGRGAFGKSAKMEVALRYIELGGRRIPLEGSYRQEGEGNTAATVGAVLGAGIVGGLLVTGRSAVIPAGRELQARTIDAIPVELADAGGVAIAASYVPSAVQTGRPETAERGAPARSASSRRRR